MLTKSRVDTLERGYNLINSPCNAKIEAQLTNGDPAAAATTLLKYFEKTHKGDGMLRFCTFLRDESEEAGGSVVLEGLADRIERALKDLGVSGTTQHAIMILTSSLSNMNTHTHTHTRTHKHVHTHYWNIPILYTVDCHNNELFSLHDCRTFLRVAIRSFGLGGWITCPVVTMIVIQTLKCV